MNFKDIIKKDVQDVFLNTEEFSDLHVINDKEMAVQIDANELIEREKLQSQNMDGIHKNQKLIYVAADEFGPMPKQGAVLKLDGKIYKVEDVANEDGVYSITLGANKA